MGRISSAPPRSAQIITSAVYSAILIPRVALVIVRRVALVGDVLISLTLRLERINGRCFRRCSFVVGLFVGVSGISGLGGAVAAVAPTASCRIRIWIAFRDLVTMAVHRVVFILILK